jgi:hypothetical protein
LSHHYRIDTDRKLVTVAYEGKITVEEVIALIDQVVADKAYEREMDAISDFSQANVTWTLAELDRFRVYISKIKFVTGPSNWAIIFPPGKDTSTARMFIALHNAFEGTIKVKLFNNEDAAMKWLMQTAPSELPR